MARIDIERKKSVWPWIIGLLVLIAIVWGLFALLGNHDAERTAMEPTTTEPITDATADPIVSSAPVNPPVTIAPMPPPPTEADDTPIPVAVIVVGPSEFLGQPVAGTAEVAEVPSDRGFWLQQDGQRMFAVIARSPGMEDAINVNPGQQVRLAGVVYDNALATQIAGGLDPETTQVIAGQPAFLLVDPRNITLVDAE